MIWLRRITDGVAAARGMSPIRKLRYACLAVAIVGLIWSGYLLVDARHRSELTRTRAADLRRAVAELRLQVKRQEAAASRLPGYSGEDETTAEALIARVGEAARQSGLHLAQSRCIASPASTQPAAPPPPQGSGAQTSAPATPPTDPGGVEFHLTGTYAALQRLLKTIGQSRSRFQVITLDVLRSKIAEKTGTAQLDIRLICLL